MLPPGPAGVWYDYRTEHAERLTFGVAQAAAGAGAVLANYVDVIEPIRDGRRIAGVSARDGVDGELLPITARVTINAAGAYAGRLMAAFGVGPSPLLVKAMNLVTARPAPQVACGAPTADGRLLFALPWQGQLAIGTWHGPTPCGADAGMVTADELDRFLVEVREAFPDLALTPDDVTLVQRGVVPAAVRHGRLSLANRPIIREHRHDGVDGAITLVGVKYTTARAAAERAVTLATAQLGRHAAPRTTRSCCPAPFRATNRARCPAWTRRPGATSSASTGRRRPGSRPRPSRCPRWRRASRQRCPWRASEIVEAARHESALTLDDVVLHRTGLGSARYPGDEVIIRVERILRNELGWTSARANDEIRLLKEFYLPVRV